METDRRRHLPFGLVFASFAAYYFALYGDLLVFEEARVYIRYGGWIHSEFPYWFYSIFSPSPNFSRYTSTLFFWFTRGVCGYGVEVMALGSFCQRILKIPRPLAVIFALAISFILNRCSTLCENSDKVIEGNVSSY